MLKCYESDKKLYNINQFSIKRARQMGNFYSDECSDTNLTMIQEVT